MSGKRFIGLKEGEARVGMRVGYADVNLMEYEGVITNTGDGIYVLVAWRDHGGFVAYRQPVREWIENLSRRRGTDGGHEAVAV